MIYLDNSATTRVDREAAEIAMEMMVEYFGNPSSPYLLGGEALEYLTQARFHIAKVISAPTKNIYFTSGGTESNNIAIMGALYAYPKSGKRIIATAIEHASVKDVFRHLEHEGYEVVFIQPREGRIQAEDVIAAVNENTALVSVMAVNNETGEVLPVKEIVEGVKKRNVHTIVHCDCVQGFCKMPFKLYEIPVDLLSMSAHKIHGPKGCGALYVKEGIRIKPLFYGGSQESGLRPGTENVALAVAFGYVANNAIINLDKKLEYIKGLNSHLVNQLRLLPQVQMNSPKGASPYIVNFSIPSLDTEQMIRYLKLKGIMLSGSAACSRGDTSHVVAAMGFDEQRIKSTLRIGLGKDNKIEEINCLIKIIKEMIMREGRL
ncbi:MAG: cysteine desulfurase family protein [Niameybacter sp.]